MWRSPTGAQMNTGRTKHALYKWTPDAPRRCPPVTVWQMPPKGTYPHKISPAHQSSIPPSLRYMNGEVNSPATIRLCGVQYTRGGYNTPVGCTIRPWGSTALPPPPTPTPYLQWPIWGVHPPPPPPPPVTPPPRDHRTSLDKEKPYSVISPL